MSMDGEAKMKIYRIGKKDLQRKMDDWFKKRTEKHISLVEKYCNKAIEFNSEFSELKDRIKTHDQTKFKEPELDPYVYITWILASLSGFSILARLPGLSSISTATTSFT